MASPAAATNLVEVADPPVPNRTSPIREMSTGEKLKLTLSLLAFGSVLCVASWWMLQHHVWFYGVVAGAVGLLCIAVALSSKNLVAGCPFCGAKIDTIPSKDRGEGQHIHCGTCHEYSIANTGILRPLDPNTTSETPKFETPVFQNTVWPKGCVACGETPARLDDLSKTTVGAAHALLGHVAVVRGAVKGIPYCDRHRDKLSMKIGIDKKLILCWTSLRMMRRYLAANRNRQAY